MAKKKQSQNEDEIIANGLITIRKGLLEKNLEIIAGGYEQISGEKIDVLTPLKTRLEVIRDKIANDSTDKAKEIEKIVQKEETKENKSSDEEPEEKIALVENKQGNILTYSTVIDEEERKKNIKMAKTRSRGPVIRRQTGLKDTSDVDPSKDVVRLNLSNTPPYRNN